MRVVSVLAGFDHLFATVDAALKHRRFSDARVNFFARSGNRVSSTEFHWTALATRGQRKRPPSVHLGEVRPKVSGGVNVVQGFNALRSLTRSFSDAFRCQRFAPKRVLHSLSSIRFGRNARDPDSNHLAFFVDDGGYARNGKAT